jgi:hypothetical protein
MPLFGSKQHSPPPVEPAPVRANRHSTSSQDSPRRSIFSRHSHPTTSPHSDLDSPGSRHSHSLSKRESLTKGGIFNRKTEDPSIGAARERVVAAENAERDADRALIQARASVRAAREHVRQLELEAEEDARLAKIKQQQASQIGKRAKPLGRK